MPKIKISRFIQDPAYCAVASSACVANSWDNNIDYQQVKAIADNKISKEIGSEGLYTGQICSLLNLIGFKKVTLVTSNFDIIDYSWENYGKKKLLVTFEDACKKKKDRDERGEMRSILKWYSKGEYDNNIIIDFHFGDYIRESINRGVPVILTFNWTMFFRFAKEDDKSNLDPVNGSFTEHAVTCYGYDKRGVNICDSHHEYYKYSRKQYRTGFYKISWEKLMTILGEGDVIIPEDYNRE